MRILYLAGKTNIPADALSRQGQDAAIDIGLHPVTLELGTLSTLAPDFTPSQLKAL